MHVLVAEDDPISAKLLVRELSNQGHDVTHCADGDSAWETIQERSISVVITDWMMPGIDGPELCRRVRSLWQRGYVYVIFLTSRGDPEDREVAVRAGADDFLTKPLDRIELSARLTAAGRILQMQSQLKERNQELQKKREELTTQHMELARREKQLRQAYNIAELARNRFSQLFEGLPVAGFTFDAEGKVFEWNQRAAETFFTPAHVALNRKLWELLGDNLVGPREREQIQTIFDGQSFENLDWNDGKLYLLVGGHPIYSHSGEITGGISTAIDVTPLREAEARIDQQNQELSRANLRLNEVNTQLRDANRRMAALATEDGLTGIPNHRAFQEALAGFVDQSKNGRPFSLAMVDVDLFKSFNDLHGHQAGDEVLVAVAEKLREALRKTDFVARYGGEEFCALFRNADEARALYLCERLRKSIEHIDLPYQKVTASFGACSFGGDIDSGEKLINAADIALYRAKDTGRNRSCGFHIETVEIEDDGIDSDTPEESETNKAA